MYIQILDTSTFLFVQCRFGIMEPFCIKTRFCYYIMLCFAFTTAKHVTFWYQKHMVASFDYGSRRIPDKSGVVWFLLYVYVCMSIYHTPDWDGYLMGSLYTYGPQQDHFLPIVRFHSISVLNFSSTRLSWSSLFEHFEIRIQKNNST